MMSTHISASLPSTVTATVCNEIVAPVGSRFCIHNVIYTNSVLNYSVEGSYSIVVDAMYIAQQKKNYCNTIKSGQ